MRTFLDFSIEFFETLVDFVQENTDWRLNFFQSLYASDCFIRDRRNITRLTYGEWITSVEKKIKFERGKVSVFSKTSEEKKSKASMLLAHLEIFSNVPIEEFCIELELFETGYIFFKDGKFQFKHNNPRNNKDEIEKGEALTCELNRKIKKKFIMSDGGLKNEEVPLSATSSKLTYNSEGKPGGFSLRGELRTREISSDLRTDKSPVLTERESSAQSEQKLIIDTTPLDTLPITPRSKRPSSEQENRHGSSSCTIFRKMDSARKKSSETIFVPTTQGVSPL